MRLIVAVLLAVSVVVGILPYVSYGQTPRRADHGNTMSQPVCVTNLRSGTMCEFNVEPHQPMVMIRGQLLPAR